MFEPYNYLKDYYHFPEVKKLEPIKIKMITPNKINISNHKSNIDIITAKEIPIKNHQSYINVIQAKEKPIDEFKGFSKDKVKAPPVKIHTSDISKFYGAYNKSLPEVMRDRLQTEEGIPNDFNRRQRQMASNGSYDLQEIDNADEQFEKDYKEFMNTYEARRKGILDSPLMTENMKNNLIRDLDNAKTNLPNIKVERLKQPVNRPVNIPVNRPVIRPVVPRQKVEQPEITDKAKEQYDKELKEKYLKMREQNKKENNVKNLVNKNF
jgi:hypothetical protein